MHFVKKYNYLVKLIINNINMKYKNLFLVLWLITIWSLFFAIYKYFMWWIFKTEIITLQYISWYLSIGTIWSFIIGWLLYELFREKKYHFFISIASILCLLSILFFVNSDIEKTLLVGGITLILWFFYWLWGVLRNILIAWQIQETWLWDTKVNGIANIFFITSIIIWSIVWWIIAEKLNLIWIWIIIWILITWLMIWTLFSYKNIKESISYKQKIVEYKNNYLKDFIFIFKKYWIIMIFVSLIITIGTILSQKAIEYFVEFWGKTSSWAAIILLYSAIWSIIWNIISMKITKNRWTYFLIFSILFAICCFLFPYFFSSFTYTSLLAWIAWIFFWMSYNLLEAYFFKKIWDDNKKPYGAVSLWVVTSIVIAIMMFWVDIIGRWFWINGVYYFMGIILCIIGVSIFILKTKLDSYEK